MDGVNNGGITTFGLVNQNNFEIAIGTIPNYQSSELRELGVLLLWQWNGGNPAARNEDAIHVKWSSSAFSFSTQNYSKVDTRTSYLGNVTAYNESTAPAESAPGEFAFYTNVYSGFAEGRGGLCGFKLIPRYPMYRGDTHSASISATYYHDKAMMPFNLFGGISIDLAKVITINVSGIFGMDSLSHSYVYKYKR